MWNWTKQLLQSVFKIQPEEIALALTMFVYLLSAVGSFIVGRITRSVLFLEIPDFKAQLPYMYIGIAIAVSAIMYGYSRVERKLRRDRTNLLTLAILLVVTLACRLALGWLHGPEHAWFLWLFYIWIEICGSFVIVQFWSLANEIYHARQAKRLFAIIGAGGVLANVVAGFGTRGLSETIGTENLLFIAVGLLMVAGAMVVLAGRLARDALTTAHQKAVPYRKTMARKTAPAREPIFASRHLRTIAMIVVITYLVSTVVDYQFQVVIAESIGAKDARSAFMGLFFGVTGILAAAVQLFATGRLLERFGVLFALLLLPGAMFSGSALMIIFPTLLMASFTKGSENVLRYTVNDATVQLLYLPVPAAQRGRAKTFIEGILRPLAVGAAGLLLALLSGSLAKQAGLEIGSQHYSALAAGLLAIWIVLLFRLKGEYVSSLLNTLQRRKLDFSDASLKINDEATLNVIREALVAPKRGHVLHALELAGFVEKVDEQMRLRVVTLLDHADVSVRIAALDFLSQGRVPLPLEQIAPHLEAGDQQLRAAAIRAYCALGHEKAVARMRVFLDDASPLVRGAAVSALIRFGGLDGIMLCAETLKAMLASADPAMRERGAWVLGDIGVKTFYHPLLPLLRDDDDRVRAAALDAAGKLLAPELVPVLIEQLSRHATAHRAVQALIAYGAGVERQLVAVLDDERADAEVRRALPRVLSRLGKGDTIAALQRYLDDRDLALREAAMRALNYMVSVQPGIRIDEHRIRRCITEEVRGVYEAMAIGLDVLVSPDQGLLLHDTLGNRRGRGLQRIFRLLGLIYPGNTLEVVFRNLRSRQTAVRANAVELLDNLLDSEEKSLVLPLLEDRPLPQLIKEAPIKIERANRARRLRDLLAHPDAWLRVCGLHVIGTLNVGDLRGEVESRTLDPDPSVRQTALWAMQRLGNAADLRRAVALLRADADPGVARYAASLSEAGA